MIIKLKTLADIDKDFLQEKGYSVLCPTAFKLIKQEAIKHIKVLQNAIIVKNIYYNEDNAKKKYCFHWIMEFFNITEEDLK